MNAKHADKISSFFFRRHPRSVISETCLGRVMGGGRRVSRNVHGDDDGDYEDGDKGWR